MHQQALLDCARNAHSNKNVYDCTASLPCTATQNLKNLGFLETPYKTNSTTPPKNAITPRTQPRRNPSHITQGLVGFIVWLLDIIEWKRSLKNLWDSSCLENGFVHTGYYLKSITVYPIKSCGGFSTRSWPLSSNGLRNDRQWILRSLTGEILTQKKVPELGFISTFIDLSQGILFVDSPSCKERLQITLESEVYEDAIEEIELYGTIVNNNETNAWFSEAIGRTCSLLRRLSLEVQKGISRRAIVKVSASRFRPNLVVSGGRPYAEDGWRILCGGLGGLQSHAHGPPYLFNARDTHVSGILLLDAVHAVTLGLVTHANF
ncbi:hypothetical protein VNO80_21228 [Phaseolus coccineus]|uniref:Molybdenum cofactor sulfurase middle domain-containing protein n=1 Tax=Phaseolus coccineus TaxID=3886 RepID=A0AAN9M230_PHACN